MATRAESPKLIVTLVIDQFSANLFTQYRGHYTGGLRRLADQGLVSVNGYQTHGLTETCPGHSTILTGMHPTHTGIPSNGWVDGTTGQYVYCLANLNNTLAHGRNDTDNGPVGHENLKVETLSDWLLRVSPDSKVFAVSGKDRGAINLAGARGRAFWLTNGFGLTTYVEPGQSADERLAPVKEFNRRYPAAESAQAWTGQGQTCAVLERDWAIGTEIFQSRLTPGNITFDNSPLLDEETLKAAEYLLDSQQLGRGDTVDMLGVSLSATDRIGHTYGTQGPEMCEQMQRVDKALGHFLDKLEQVPGGVLLVLTADHGGSDFVERLAAHGYPHARRADMARLAEVSAALRERFNLEADPLRNGGSGIMVVGADRTTLPDPIRQQVAEAAVEMLRGLPDTGFVETRDRVLAMPVPESANPEMLDLTQRARLSAVAGRSPDILFSYKPNVVAPSRIGGALSGHGSPWEYDRRVPIIFWWPGVAAQERFLPIRTIDIAPTLANVIGVEPNGELDGRCIDLGVDGVPQCKND